MARNPYSGKLAELVSWYYDGSENYLYPFAFAAVHFIMQQHSASAVHFDELAVPVVCFDICSEAVPART